MPTSRMTWSGTQSLTTVRSDEQRDLVLRAGAEPGVVQVAEDVLAGTDLGDHAAGGELDGGGGAGADHLCGDPGAGEAAYRGGERGVLVLRGALASVRDWSRRDLDR